MKKDIIDIKLDSIKINEVKDSSRNNRAKRIYQNGDVEIYDVDEFIDGGKTTYDIKAKVKGSRGKYKTQIKIKDNVLTKYSCECLDYYGGYLCKHILATCYEASKPSRPSTEEKKKVYYEEQRIKSMERMKLYLQEKDTWYGN